MKKQDWNSLGNGPLDRIINAGVRNPYGMGTMIPEDMTTVEAQEIAGLGYGPEARPLYRPAMDAFGGDALGPDGGLLWEEEPNAKAIVRTDTNSTLATVSGRYNVFDCGQILDLAARASGKAGASLASAGSFHNGRITFALARIGEYGIRGPMGTSDHIEKFALISGRHDGEGGVQGTEATGRPFCLNMLTSMLKGVSSIRHTSSIIARTDALVDRMLEIRAGIEPAKAQDQALADNSMGSQKLVGAYLRAWQVVEGPLVGLGGGEVTDKEAQRLFKARQVVSSWLANMDDPRQGNAGLQGTLWAAFQSVTQWANHEAPVRPGAAHPDARQARLFGATLGASTSKAGQFVTAVRSELLEAV
jgi:hypothetical protein